MQGGLPRTIEAESFVPKDREREIPAVPGDRGPDQAGDSDH